MREFFLNSIRAYGYSFWCLGPVLVLALTGGIYNVIVLKLAELLGKGIAETGMTTFAPAAALAMIVIAWLVVWGVHWRFLFSGVRMGTENSPEKPELSFSIPEAILTSLMMLCLVPMFILPVITLPLLPLALLAYAHTGDGRAFDPRWVFRAIGREPLAWLMMLGMMVVWAGIAFVLFILTIYGMKELFGWIRPSAGDGGDAVAYLIVFLFSAISMFFWLLVMTIPTRFIGLLGHHFPGLLDILPKKPNLGVSVISVVGGVVLAGIVWTSVFLIPSNIAKSSNRGGYAAGSSGWSSPPPSRGSSGWSPPSPSGGPSGWNPPSSSGGPSRGGTFPPTPADGVVVDPMQHYLATEEGVRQDLKRFHEDATKYKEDTTWYPSGHVAPELTKWLVERGVDVIQRYPNGTMKYQFTTTAVYDKWAAGPYILIVAPYENLETHHGTAITNTGQLVPDSLENLTKRVARETADARMRFSKDTGEIAKHLQQLLEITNRYKEDRGIYPWHNNVLMWWLESQGSPPRTRYPRGVLDLYTLSPTAEYDATATAPYVLFSFHPGNFNDKNDQATAITNTGQIVTDSSTAIQERISSEWGAAMRRAEERYDTAKSSSQPSMPRPLENVPAPEQIRKRLELLHEDATGYKETHGKYPTSSFDIRSWLSQQKIDAEKRYSTLSFHLDSNSNIQRTSALDPWTIGPYILFIQTTHDASQPYDMAWGITNTGEIVSDQRHFMFRRAIHEYAQAEKRKGEEWRAQHPALSGETNSPPNRTTPPANRFTAKPDDERKFPHKAVPIGVSDADKVRLAMENLWADLQEYREDNDGKLPAALRDLTPRYTDYNGIRHPDVFRGEYTYNPKPPASGLEILVAEPEDRMGAAFRQPPPNPRQPRQPQQPQPPKVCLALLNNGTVVEGFSPEAIRRQYVSPDDEGIDWGIAGWSPADPDKVPFGKLCRVLLTIENGGGYAGVDTGPAAKDLADKAYLAYRDATLANFKTIAPEGAASVREVPNSKVNNVAYHRYVAAHKASGKTVTVFTGVENGRCVAYWFFGASKHYGAFQSAVGKAAVKPTTKPTTTR